MNNKNTICLWYNGDALEAATFYANTFPDSEVKAVHRAPGDYPSGKQGDELTVEFTVLGIPCVGLNGGPCSSTVKRFPFRCLPRIRRKPTVCGMPSSTTVGRRALAVGARTSGGCRGRSRRGCWSMQLPVKILPSPSVHLKR